MAGNRNGALDVLRVLAIVAVVNCHAVSTLAKDRDLAFLQLGGKGVDLFFVLSGWLLGSQLCVELKETGKIKLLRFLTRRWLRTLPAYYLVLAFTLLQQYLLKPTFIYEWQYAVFLQNYLSTIPYFGISWSLCVEEYFYLLVAPCLLLAYQFYTLRWLLILVLGLPAFCRAMGWYGQLTETHVRYDQCASGVLLAAVSVFAPVIWAWLTRLSWLLTGIGLALLAVNILRRLEVLDGGDFCMEIWTFIFATLLLLATTSLKETRYCRSTLMQYMASRSYAIYLLHIESLSVIRRLPDIWFPFALALTWAVSLLLAEILYRLVERPFMDAREWFTWSRD